MKKCTPREPQMAGAPHRPQAMRRDFLRVGWLGGLGLSLGSFLERRSAHAASSVSQREATAKSVIHIYLQGGFPHMDSFDPKPTRRRSIVGSWLRLIRRCRTSTSASTWRGRRELPTS